MAYSAITPSVAPAGVRSAPPRLAGALVNPVTRTPVDASVTPVRNAADPDRAHRIVPGVAGIASLVGPSPPPSWPATLEPPSWPAALEPPLAPPPPLVPAVPLRAPPPPPFAPASVFRRVALPQATPSKQLAVVTQRASLVCAMWEADVITEAATDDRAGSLGASALDRACSATVKAYAAERAPARASRGLVSAEGSADHSR